MCATPWSSQYAASDNPCLQHSTQQEQFQDKIASPVSVCHCYLDTREFRMSSWPDPASTSPSPWYLLQLTEGTSLPAASPGANWTALGCSSDLSCQQQSAKTCRLLVGCRVMGPDFNVWAASSMCKFKSDFEPLRSPAQTGLYTPGKVFIHRYVKIYFQRYFYTLLHFKLLSKIHFIIKIPIKSNRNIMDLELILATQQALALSLLSKSENKHNVLISSFFQFHKSQTLLAAILSHQAGSILAFTNTKVRGNIHKTSQGYHSLYTPPMLSCLLIQGKGRL